MKTKMILVAAVVVLAGAGLLATGHSHAAAAESAAGQEKTLYTCGMHPQVIQDHPGNCPICGMKLTPVRKQDAAAAQAIAIDPVTVQNMGIRTATVTRGPLRRIIRTVGTVDYDETALTEVTTKFKGWVQKLDVNTTGALVMRGETLFEVYSPELYSAQVEYLSAIESPTNVMSGADALRTSALTKLKFYDISDDQIAELEKTRQAQKTLRISAPRDGFVIEKMVVEGQMVDAGMKIFRLADLGLVWVQAQIYEQDLAYIKLGQEATVTLSYLADRTFRGRVTYIYPNVDEKTRTVQVRMEFHNPGYFLKPGMFATVQVACELAPSALLVPDMAVLRSGEKTTVFVALDGGKFDPRTVALGVPAENDMYQVLAGLSEGERIVTSGQFMLDSESQLREAIQKMMAPNPSGAPVSTGGAIRAAAPAPAEPSAEAKYICPMPEHVSIEYDHPGPCPICGMALIPVSAENLSKLPPGGKLLYYTCPMPEHSDVHADKPGKCPKCAMTLIPVMEAPQTAPAATNAVLYTCPMAMHADVVSDRPGTCPRCAMDLVPTSTVKHGPKAEALWSELHPARGEISE